MLNISHVDLIVYNSVLLDLWWNMLIKFSKHIANTFAKNNSWLQRRIKSPVKHLRWSFFRKLLLASEANTESCQTSKMEVFAKIVKN